MCSKKSIFRNLTYLSRHAVIPPAAFYFTAGAIAVVYQAQTIAEMLTVQWPACCSTDAFRRRTVRLSLRRWWWPAVAAHSARSSAPS